jgi:alkanesulfonate monooxygenase SsuD/methylene tetrahydromethanopterin reductase-like flavin-dependent oxidoreductase (luciferase family)
MARERRAQRSGVGHNRRSLATHEPGVDGNYSDLPDFWYNPAVVAEASATLESLALGRIFLRVGSGEASNEQAAVGSWPKWAERSQRLIEATELIGQLWTGRQIAHDGTYCKVNARLYDAPANTIPLLMAANGPKAMHRAGQKRTGW